MRVALIGCGEVTAEKHLRVLRRVAGIEVCALVDVNAGKAAALAKAHGVRRADSDYRRVLEGNEVEAVLVATPPGKHVEIALAALAAGKHVLVEKPLALEVAEAEELAAAAAASRCVAMMGYHMRFHRVVRLGKARIGALGRVETVRAVWCNAQKDATAPAWRLRRKEGGGALTEIGVHLYDLLRYLLEDEAEEVTARAVSGGREDESAQVLVRMRKGTLAVITLSERAPHQCAMEFMGAGGWLGLNLHRFDGCEWVEAGGRPNRPERRLQRLVRSAGQWRQAWEGFRGRTDYVESYRREWEHFVAVVRGEAVLESTIADGVAGVKIIRAAWESAGAVR